MKTISILNLKGGVAKTFTAANMAYEIYRRGYRVLLIDNDKQGNLSKAYSRYDAESVAPVTRLLAGDWQGATELIQNTNYVGQQCCIDIVTSNMSLFGATWNLTKEDSENQTERYKRFADIMGGFYDYCIIDNPPDIGLDTVGVAEFFALLYIAYEVVSIFKNMALCGLPVKKVWEKVREFLAKYTDELPDTDELDGDSTTGNVEEHRTQER